jgi:uncharacterized protein
MTLAAHDYLRFQSAVGEHVLLVDGSRIYDLEPHALAGFEDEALGETLTQMLPPGNGRFVDDIPLAPPAIRALSLNVAQACNLACTYCYADEGNFGGKPQRMDEAVALDAVRLLIEQTGHGNRAVLGFMGGEPLLNRALVHSVVPKAAALAAAHGVTLQFSITTNATLVTDADASLFHDHGFTVAVSLDGAATSNDIGRPAANGRGSYAQACAGLGKLAANRPGHLSIRATVTPGANDLVQALDHLIGLGADEVGFSPVLSAPSGKHEFSQEDFAPFLAQMIACGERAKAALLARRRYPFGNFETALHEIARGTHRPYPCGAGASYASVSASGELYACHRAINDQRFAIGSLASGPDKAARTAFLAERHLSRQTPCTTCWARQLCGGGCHQEVARRGRVHCDYVRGWLAWCLAAYAEVSELASGYFIDAQAWFDGAPQGEQVNVR